MRDVEDKRKITVTITSDGHRVFWQRFHARGEYRTVVEHGEKTFGTKEEAAEYIRILEDEDNE